MKFCTMLFRDLNFEPAAIQPCCNTHDLHVPAFPFMGGSVDMPAYAQFITQVFEDIQKGREVCRGCHKLIDLKEDELPSSLDVRMSFDTVSLNMHRFLCNCRCEYCTFWHAQRVGYEILPALKSLHEQSVLSPNCFFSWGGGEPTIQPDFEEASAWIESVSPRQYVHTNAIRFSPTLQHLLGNRHAEMNVSLDSASQQIYKKVKGVDHFATVVRNLEKYRENAAESAIHLKYIIYEANNSLQEIEKFLVLAKKTLQISVVQYSFDFREVQKKALSQKTIVAAAFFEKRARDFGLNPVPFFVDEEYREAIDRLNVQ